jgi:uncharacterized LabA/DUF88 family protein
MPDSAAVRTKREVTPKPDTAAVRQTSEAFPIHFHERDRVQLIIDGANFFATLRSLGLRVDYEKLFLWFDTNTRFIRPQFYGVIKEASTENQEYGSTEGFHKLLDFLDYNGYDVITKQVFENINQDGHVVFRGTMIVEMAVGMINAADAGCDHIVLFTGDGELTAAVREVKERGAKVTVVSNESKRIISQSLRRECDQFVDLLDIPQDQPDSFIGVDARARRF